MSDLFSYDAKGIEAQLDAADAAPSIDSLEEIDAPAFRGIGRGLAYGWMRGSAAVSDFMATFGKQPAMSDEQERINNLADQIQEEQRQTAIDMWTPKPNEVGRVGQVVGSLAEVGPPLLAGVGNPALLVGSTTLKTGKELVDQGVDANTAGGVAAIEGAANYAGFKVPIVGKTLATRLASGAAGNVVVGSASRAAEGGTLESQGYEKQAEPFSQDLGTFSTDALTGMLFGGVHHLLEPGEAPSIDPKLNPSQADAVLTARNAKNFAEGTTPGTPDGLHAEVAHQQALETSLSQLSRGEEVNVGDTVARFDGGFKDADHVAESVALNELVQQVEPKDVPRAPESVRREENIDIATRGGIDRFPEFPQDQVKVEEGTGDEAGIVTVTTPNGRTRARVTDKYIKVLDTETSEAARRTGEGAARMKRLMQKAEQEGKTLTSDTQVSKKQQGFYERLAERGFDIIRNDAHKFSDGTLISDDSRPVFEIHPKRGEYDFGHEHPAQQTASEFKGLRSDVRADQNVGGHSEGEPGLGVRAADGGRGEPLTVFRGGVSELRGQEFERGSLETATTRPALGLGAHFTSTAKRAAHYGDVTEHHLDIRNPYKIPYDELPNFETPAEYRAFADALRAEGYDGVAVDASHVGGPTDYYAFDRAQVLDAGSLKEKPNAEAPATAKPEAEQAKATEESAPETTAVSRLVESQPDTPVLTGYDAEGQPVKTTLAEAHAESQAQLERDLNDSKAYEAAITCFLGRGA